MRKRIFTLLLAAMLVLSAGITVYAHDVPDLSLDGTITVTMRIGSTVVPGGSMTIYRVGDIHEEDGNYSFVLSEAFSGSAVALDAPQSAAAAKNLADYAVKQSVTGVTQRILRNGKVTFAVEPGLYLLVQKDASSGYAPASPFLISVPNMKDGSYVYDVDATPKVEIQKVTETTTPPPTKPASPNLPQTGSDSWKAFPMMLLGAALIAGGWMLRKKESYES